MYIWSVSGRYSLPILRVSAMNASSKSISEDRLVFTVLKAGGNNESQHLQVYIAI